MNEMTKPVLPSNMPAKPAPMTPQEVRAWLDAEYAPLALRRDEMVKALEVTLKAHPVIKSAEELAVFIENIKTAKEVTKLAVANHTTAKEPFLNGGRAVDAWKASIIDPLTAAIAKLQPVMDTWGRAEDARKKAEAAAEAKRLADEADAAAKAAMAAKTEPEQEAAYDALNEVAARQAKAEKAVIATPADRTRTRGDFGAVGSMRTTWRWELTDISKVPAQYLCVDVEALKAALRERDPKTNKPIAVIPGIRVYPDTSMQVR
jgi:hypothetical protein